MFRKLSFLTVFCILGFGLVFAGGQTSATQGGTTEGPIVLSFGELNPDGHPMADAAYEFARLVNEKSNGSITIEVFPAGQLGDERTQIQNLQIGAQDIFRANANSMGDFGATKSNLFSLPFIFRNREHIWNVLNGEIGDEILADVEQSDSQLVALGFLEEGARSFFFTNKLVQSVEDMRGLKIRVPQTQILLDTVAAFGASPTPIAYSELYSALQTGVVDGAENPPTGYLSNSFYEVAPYYTLNEHIYSPSIMIMSESRWNSLSANQKSILQEAADEVRNFNRAQAAQRDEEALAELRAKGVEIVEIQDKGPWQAMVQPVYERYGADFIDLISQIQAVR